MIFRVSILYVIGPDFFSNHQQLKEIINEFMNPKTEKPGSTLDTEFHSLTSKEDSFQLYLF